MVAAAGLIFALGVVAGSNRGASAALALFDGQPAIGSTITGRASVIDGDIIDIRGTRIRLNGIDAPESAQTCEDRNGKSYRCGAKAAEALATLLASSSPTHCTIVTRDRYRRSVAECVLANGVAVQRAMVARGWALDWPRYSKGRYASDQNAAIAAKRGIWVGRAQPPWEWRASRR